VPRTIAPVRVHGTVRPIPAEGSITTTTSNADTNPAEAEAKRFPTPATGLTAAQVAERVAAGRTNATDTRSSRSLTQILRANVITPFNGLLATLFVIILATGRWQNGLFGLVIVANTAIGVVQEVRAKRTLDRLAVLNAPHATVIRDGLTAVLPVEEVVADDLLELRTGDQVPADGVTIDSNGLELDESLLTGESDPIAKSSGDDVRSGSIVVAGSGRFQATAVGAEAYATQLSAEARRFTLVQSELVGGTNRLLRWIALMMLLVGPLLLWSQFRSSDNKNWQEAVTGAVAALVGMVPEGMVLLTSLAFFVAALALTRRKTLVQELPAVEVLARVDVVCLDKTGTLTHGDIVFDDLRLLTGAVEDDVRQALALSASGDDANATAAALAAHFTGATWTRAGGIPFSSARKWQAVIAADHGTWVLGAPEMVLPDPQDEGTREAREKANAIAAEGRRVLLLASTPQVLEGENAALPAGLTPQALVVLAERVREDAADTLRYFKEQGVALKVISGDNPRTVGAVAAAVGVAGVSGADDAVDARTLPDDIDELGGVLEEHSVFGRVTPHQKRAVVAALQKRGHVVAMTGDGVNDALALKDAEIGVAMGSGSAATRAVAQLVLLDGKFSHLPEVVAEGRRVIANIERAASLFLVKNVYSLGLALIIIVTAAAYPLAPIQLSLISNLTIGIPAFLLAMAPNNRRYIPGFLTRVLRFSVPVGIVIAATAFTGYKIIRAVDSTAGVTGGRTVATLVVLICALWTLLAIARPLAGWKVAMVAAIIGVAALIVVIPAFATDVFLLHPTPQRVLVGVLTGAVGAGLVEIAHRAVAADARRRAAAQAAKQSAEVVRQSTSPAV
jgi:cation-transporting ATPase E